MSEDVARQAELVAARREELSHTVAALAERFDVKARTRDAVADLRSSAVRQLRPERVLAAVVVLGTIAAAVSGLMYWRGRRRLTRELTADRSRQR